MIDFDVLASSSEGCAYRLSGGGATAPLLIECGLPWKALQRALGFKVSELAGCLISHSHQDHCKAAKEIMAAGVRCFASLATWAAICGKDVSHNCAFMAQGWEGFLYGGWIVRPFDAVHDCEGTLGFVIDSPHGDRLLYLTDSAYSRVTFPGLTRIAVECNHSMELLKANALEGKIDRARFSRTAKNHMSLERLVDLLKANDLSKVERITLLHLSDANSDEVEFKDAVQRATGIPVEVAQRGLEVKA